MNFDRNQIPALMADVALGSLEMGTAFKVKTQHGIGTCFLYADQRGSFYVTAAHLLEKAKVGEHVHFAYKDSWTSRTLLALYLHPDGHDVAAFVTDQKIHLPSMSAEEFGVMPGQPLKFVGFPHGLHGEYPSDTGFLTPLVRTAHFSGTIVVDGKRLTLLDGFNNPGYSGSPVYCCGNDGSPKLFGVVSGYRWEKEEHSRVYQKMSDGSFKPTADYIVRPNSGMIYVVGKKEYLELFKTIEQFHELASAPA